MIEEKERRGKNEVRRSLLLYHYLFLSRSLSLCEQFLPQSGSNLKQSGLQLIKREVITGINVGSRKIVAYVPQVRIYRLRVVLPPFYHFTQLLCSKAIWVSKWVLFLFKTGLNGTPIGLHQVQYVWMLIAR
jgi:hypothetical protein